MVKRFYRIFPNRACITAIRSTQNLALKFTIAAVLAVFTYSIYIHRIRYVQLEYQRTNLYPEFGLSESEIRTSNDSEMLFDCFNKSSVYRVQQRGQFWVLYNYVQANRWFACHESITLTTIGDLTFLDNLKPLVERWNGPISVALYTPGTDLETAIHIIRYLRTCVSPLISEYVTFNLYFESSHRPRIIPPTNELFAGEPESCTATPPPWQTTNKSSLYKSQKGLTFPINVGRNIARDAATTHFILASDIELYPSENVISSFLNMIRQNGRFLRATTPGVFVLSPFEVEENAMVPRTKAELIPMLKNHSAIRFHWRVCPSCHAIPAYQNWLKAEIGESLRVIHTAKKKSLWEPFYIGTNQEPYFDERLDWEGRCNKLAQAYSMCILNYDYHILDNAFLVHKPGIKRYHADRVRDLRMKGTISLIRNEIEPDIHLIYGKNKNCTKWY